MAEDYSQAMDDLFGPPTTQPDAETAPEDHDAAAIDAQAPLDTSTELQEPKDENTGATGPAVVPPPRIGAPPETSPSRPPLHPSTNPLIDEFAAPEKPAAPAEDYTDAMREVVGPTDAEKAQREKASADFLRWRSENSTVSPSDALDVLKYSEATGMPPGYVSEYLPDIRKNVDASKVDFDQIARTAPALSGFLAENGYHLPAVKDDLGHLSLMEWAIKGPTTALEDGAKALWGSARKLADATGLGGAENAQKINELEAEQQDHGDYGAHNFFTKGLIGLSKTAPLLLVDQVARFLGGSIAGRVLGMGGAVASEVAGAGPEDPLADVGAVASLFGGKKLGEELGSFHLNAAISYADTNWELQKIRGPDGRALDPAVRQVLALTVGTINGGVMALAGVGGHLLGPGAEAVDKEVLNREGIEAAKRLLMDPTKLAAIQRYARRFGVHEASALFIGAIQSGLNDVASQIAKVKTGQARDLSAGELLDTAWQGAWKTAQDMMLLSAGNAGLETRTDVRNSGVARELLTNRGQEVATTQSAERLQAINRAASATNAGLAQGSLKELVRRMGDQPVHIDAAGVKRLASERGVDPAELARTIAGDDGSAWAEAERTGGDLVAPGPGYVEFARTDATGAQSLLPDSRLNSDALTPRQHTEEEARFMRRAAEVAKLPPEALEESSRRVYDDFKTKAMFAGIDPQEADASARQVAAASQTWAERFAERGGGEPDAWSLYQLQDLKITGADGRTLGIGDFSKTQPATAVEPDHEAIAQPRGDFEKLLNEPGQDAAMRRFYEDPVTGLRNERAAALAPADESKPQVLHFGVEGIKFRNDDLQKGGHNKADELLRAVAEAAHKLRPDVYRAGGDFAVPVADEADGKAFLEEVRKNLPEQAKGYGLTGRVGEDLKAARTAHDLAKQEMEAKGQRVERGNRPSGLPEGQDAGTTIPSKKVEAQLGEEHKQRFAALTSTREGRDQVFRTVHIEPETGLLTRQGFDARPQKKYRASIDLNGLKRVQEKLALHMPKEEARAFGDQMLEEFGLLAKEAKGLDFDFFHDHGDEYGAQSDNEQELETFLNELREFARGAEMRVPGEKDGVSGTWTYKKLMFGFGIGEARDENAAERALNADKLDLAKRGERLNEDQPDRLFFTPDQVHRASGAVDQGSEGVLEGDDRGGAVSSTAAGDRQLQDAGTGAPASGEAGEGQGGSGAAPEGSGRGIDAAPEVAARERNNVDRVNDAWREVQDAFGLHQKNGRGRVDFTPAGGGKRRSFNIQILEHADKSTLAHETFHFLNQVMGDLAQRADAPESLKADYVKLLKFMGFDSHEQRVAENAERVKLDSRLASGEKLADDEEKRRTELHAKEERATHAWEQYLVEGTAPSADLVGVFGKLRSWLTGIYRKVAGAQGNAVKGIQEQYRQSYGQEIGLSDDVRQVFDRILASDDAVKRAAAANEAARPFAQLEAKMSPEERADYQRQTAGAQARAQTEMIRRLAEVQHRENVGFLRAERQRLTEEADADLDKDPVYRAIKYLQDGELPGGTPAALLGEDGKPQKLDKNALRRKYDAETVSKLPRGIFAPKGEKGANVEDLAELLGFQDGHDMLGKLLAARPRKEVVKARVAERMTDLHGAALQDAPRAMMDTASSALHNSDAVQKVLLERRKLLEMASPGKGGHAIDLSPEYLRRLAEDAVANQTVRKLTGGRDGAAGYYLRAERTATQRMRKAFEAGNLTEALAQNERVLLNMHYYRAARDARDHLETIHRALQQSAEDPWRATLGKADVAATGKDQPNDHAFLGAHDAILQAIGMQPAHGAPDVNTLDRLVAAVGSEGIGFDVEKIRGLLAKPTMWADLTHDQAEQVLAATKNIRHAANAQLGFELNGKKMDRSEWFKLAQEHALKTEQLPARAVSSSGDTGKEKLAKAVRGADAWLTSVASYIDTLDGGDRDGPWHKLFIDEHREARQKLVELDREIVGKIRKAIKAMPRAIRARADERVPGLSDLLPADPRYGDQVRGAETRSDLWMVFLNSGNADNAQRLRDGNGWSDAARQQALQLLTPEEARFLQGMLDTIDSLHPELAKVYERRKGLPLGKVEATPITINGEEFRGGYFPIRYDPSISRQGAVQLSDVEKALLPGGMHTPAVFSGHTKERTEVVRAPLSLELGAVQTHIAQVVQDIAMGDFVRKAGSFVLDARFAPIVDKALGQERTALFMPLLKDIASDRAGATMAAAEGQPGFIRMLMAMGRSRYARGVMALNLPSMLAHLTDPLAAIGEAEGPAAMAARAARIVPAYGKILASWKTGPREEWELSKELAYREARETENIRKELERVKLPANVFLRGVANVSDVADHVSTLVRHHLDMFHAKILWQVGFDEAIAGGSTREEAARAGDDLLAKTLPSGDIAERPAILRSKHDVAAVVTFYGYANRMYQLWVHTPISRAVDAWTGPEASPMSRLQSVSDLTAKWLVMGAVAALGAKLAGRGSDDKDDHKALLLQNYGTAGWLARRVLLEPANTIPILGPALEAVADGREVSVRTAPAAAVLGDAASKLGRAIASAKNGDGSDKLVWELLDLVTGTVLGPTGQFNRTAGYIKAASSGEAPTGPGDVASGLVYGAPRN